MRKQTRSTLSDRAVTVSGAIIRVVMADPVPTESDVETKVCEYADKVGVMHLKLNVLGRVGWPDRIFLYFGRVLFIEFKRPGEKPRKIQEYIHGKIRSHGFAVRVVDTVPDGVNHIRELTKSCPHL